MRFMCLKWSPFRKRWGEYVCLNASVTPRLGFSAKSENSLETGRIPAPRHGKDLDVVGTVPEGPGRREEREVDVAAALEHRAPPHRGDLAVERERQGDAAAGRP